MRKSWILPLLVATAVTSTFSVASGGESSAVASDGDSLEAFQRLERRAAQMTEEHGEESDPAGFTDYSPKGFGKRMALQRALLTDIARIDRSALPYNSQVTYDLIKWDAQRVLDREPFAWLQFPYTPYEFTIRGPNRVLTGFVFESDSDADDYLKLAAEYPAATASMRELISGQKANGIYLQRDVAAKVRAMISEYARPAARSFAWPAEHRLKSLSPRKVQAFRQALSTVIDRQIDPAVRSLANEFGEPYQLSAPKQYGLAQYPGGKDYYKVLVRYRLTIDKTPEQLYAESQAALDRIESDLQALRAEMGYFGPREPFDLQLSSSAKFTAKTTDDVERVYLDYMKRMDPFMPQLFCRRATFGYGVKRAAPEQEAALTFGFASVQKHPVMLGVYYYNGSNLDQRSLLPAQALIYHELAPGHYWHSAMRMLSKSATHYPRANGAFSEAWGDFAQQLAYEQGVFRTPEEKYGRRLFNAMFPARALAEIGVNYFGFDFDWGLKVLDRYTFESQLQNRSSLARDTSDWHAQILPYSFGSQELLRLREKVRFALGARFSEPRFYDAVLSTQALPFPLLDKHLDWFVEQEMTGGAPGICK